MKKPLFLRQSLADDLSKKVGGGLVGDFAFFGDKEDKKVLGEKGVESGAVVKVEAIEEKKASIKEVKEKKPVKKHKSAAIKLVATHWPRSAGGATQTIDGAKKNPMKSPFTKEMEAMKKEVAEKKNSSTFPMKNVVGETQVEEKKLEGSPFAVIEPKVEKTIEKEVVAPEKVTEEVVEELLPVVEKIEIRTEMAKEKNELNERESKLFEDFMKSVRGNDEEGFRRTIDEISLYRSENPESY